MGLFNKLKNALFEEEEIDLDSPTEKVVIKDEEPIVKKEEPIKSDLSLNNDKDLFKVENTFDFPDFDEDEFVSNYEPTFETPKETRLTRKVEPEKTLKAENIFSEKPIKITQDKPSTTKRKREREKKVPKEQTVKKIFKPSPVISPVYGVLDKNYTKEDIVSAEKTSLAKKMVDVDIARKKAFGTLTPGSLEEEIEKTLNEPMTNFYNENSKSIDELLNDSIDDAIDLNYEEPTLESSPELEELPEYENNDFTNELENELDSVDDYSMESDLEKDKPKEDKLEDTLESDLFDLIDSMYDNREED